MKRLIVTKQYTEYFTVPDDISQGDLEVLLKTTTGEVQLLQHINVIKQIDIQEETKKELIDDIRNDD